MKKSSSIIEKILLDIKKLDLEIQKQNKFDFTENSLENWKMRAEYIIDLLTKMNLHFCLIKAFDLRYIMMGDVDILVENKLELIKTYKKFQEKKWKFGRTPFNDKLKLEVIDPTGKYGIDFYPDARWHDLRYAQTGIISKQKKKDVKHGISTYVPSSEHQLYIISSHAYSHGRINLAEVLECIRIIVDEKPKIDEVVKLASKFHLQISLFVIVNFVNTLLKKYGYKEMCIEMEKYQTASERRILNKYSEKNKLNEFPVKFHLEDILLNSIKNITYSKLDKSVSRFNALGSFIKHNRISRFFYDIFYPKYQKMEFN